MNLRSISCSLFVLFSLIACRSAPQPAPVAAPAVGEARSAGWYVAKKEPLTFCPKGYQIPGMQFGILDGEYVYLADRSSRFFVPKGRDAQFYRQQALVARDASLKDQKGFIARTVESKIAWVSNAMSNAARYSKRLIGRDS